MEFTVNQGRLSAALSRALTVTDRRSTMPILATVLLRATGSGVDIVATDMMIGSTESVACKVAGQGSVAIKAHSLAAMVGRIPGGDVTLKALDNHWIQVSAKGTEAKLLGMSAGDFPELPDPDGVKFADVDSAAMAGLINKTLFSVSTDEARVNLNGGLFESNGKQATMVSTDGHRLTKYSVQLDGPKLGSGGVVVPRRGLEEIRKVLGRVDGECSIAVKDGYVFLRAGSTTLSVKLNNVTFPPWKQVVPKEFTTKATVSRSDLAAALRQAVVIAPSKTQTVKVTVKADSILLSAQDPELGSVLLDVPATWSGSGEFTTGANGSYLIDALDAIATDDVEIRLTSELDPLVLVPVADPAVDLVAVVMPMRI